jgi:iron complex transport system ATP-binding protein
MTALLVDGVSVSRGGKNLLNGFDLRVEHGEVVALVGPNGAGKTTLLRCIMGRVQPTRGTVMLDGVDTMRLSAKQRAQRVAQLAQHLVMDDEITALDYVIAARFRHDEPRTSSARAAAVALERVDAGAFRDRRLRQLSGGERQRVAFAALLAQEAAALLLDEPANHLDPARQVQSYQLLGELQSAGATLLIVTHDINLLSHLFAPEHVRVVGMRAGENLFELALGAEELPRALSELFGIPMTRLMGEGQSLIVPTGPRRT